MIHQVHDVVVHRDNGRIGMVRKVTYAGRFRILEVQFGADGPFEMHNNDQFREASLVEQQELLS